METHAAYPRSLRGEKRVLRDQRMKDPGALAMRETLKAKQHGNHLERDTRPRCEPTLSSDSPTAGRIRGNS